MRIRSIKPEYWTSEDVAALTDYFDRLLFIGLWSYVDDNAVGRDNEKLIAAKLFPLEDDPHETLARIRGGLARMSDQGLIARYASPDGRRLLMVTGWHHQKIDKPTRSPLPRYEDVPPPTEEALTWGYPEPEDPIDPIPEEPADPPRILPEDSSPGSRDLGIKGSRDQGIKGSRDLGISRARAREKRPTKDPTLIDKPLTPNRYTPVFEEFCRRYPIEEDQPRTFKAWKLAIRRADTQVILDAALQYADDPNREDAYTKAPWTWLDNDGWQNGPCRPRHAEKPTIVAKDQRIVETSARAAGYTARIDAQNGSQPSPPNLRQIGR